MAKKKSPAKGAKPPKAKPSTLTLRLDGAENTLLENVKKSTGEKTGAGAIVRLLREYPTMRETIIALTNKLKEEVKKLEDQEDLLRRLQGSLGDLAKLKLPAPKVKDSWDDDDDDMYH